MQVPGLTTEQLEIVRSFFPSDCKVQLFGSRVNGNFRELSDLDICILSDISRSSVENIRELFEESNLIFTVDIVLYKDCSDDFKKIIDTSSVML